MWTLKFRPHLNFRNLNFRTFRDFTTWYVPTPYRFRVTVNVEPVFVAVSWGVGIERIIALVVCDLRSCRQGAVVIFAVHTDSGHHRDL